MVSVTPEAALVAVGWFISLVLGLAVFPRIVRALIAKGLIKPNNPLRKAYALIFDQDVLPKVDALMEQRLEPWARKFQDLADLNIRAEAKMEELRLSAPDLAPMKQKVDALAEQFNAAVPLLNNLSGDVLEALMKKAYGDMRKAEIARGDLPPGDLTPAQQQEIEDLKRDPDGKMQLVAAENALDAAVANKLMKPATAKALKKQLEAAFQSGQPIQNVLAPYEGLIARFFGGAPSVRMLPGGGGGSGPAQF